jgi:hypothetical protein
MGLIAELMVRTYYETQGKPVYYIRQVLPGGEQQPRRSLELQVGPAANAPEAIASPLGGQG